MNYRADHLLGNMNHYYEMKLAMGGECPTQGMPPALVPKPVSDEEIKDYIEENEKKELKSL